MGAVQRRDERLNNRDSAVEGAGIAPRFQEMRFRHVPVTKFGSLIKMRADADGVLDFLAFRFLVEANLGSKIEIVRRGVNGVGAENHQRFYFACFDIGAKLAQRFEMVDGLCLRWLRVVERRPDIVERRVDYVY